MRLAIVAGKFPALSETFVLRQALALSNNSHDLTVISSEAGDDGVQHAEYAKSALPKHILYIRTERPSIFNLIRMLTSLCLFSLFSTRARQVFIALLQAAFNGCWSSVLDLAVCFTRFRNRSGFGEFDFIVAHFGTIGVRAHYLKLAGYISGPMGVVFHGADMSEYQTIKRYMKGYQSIFRSETLLLPISNFWKERLISWGADQKRIEVLRMGVRLTAFKDDRINHPIRFPLRILSVARFTEKKGLSYAISGFLASDIEAVYSIIGAGPQEAELRELAVTASGKKVITFMGKRTQEEVFEALDQTDVFLLPSVTAITGDMEGIPVALMEAMSRGVLVIATDHSGIPELVIDGETGFLVPERDSDAIAKVLMRIASGKVDLPRLRLNALEKLRQDFDGRKLDEQLEEVIRQAVHQNRSQSQSGFF